MSFRVVTVTVADPKLVFTTALKANTCNIILRHKYPACNLKPSRADEGLTKKIATAGMYLDLKVMDHIIVTSEGYYSFADEGLV
ncbi:MAG: hypothetical protein H7320_22165 [Ferruginibacter sp.]|nr:hypothetical protein [Ferruginibacter sp.]